MSKTINEIILKLNQLGNQKNRDGMARFGISVDKAFGVSVAQLRQLARPYKHDHALALELWNTGYHEARILAAIIDDPKQVTPEQMDTWVKDFDSWDVCDQTCVLFDKTPHAVEKINEWSVRQNEFERRAAFALLACLAWHAKTEPNSTFIDLLPLIEKGSTDDRNFVKKAVNWALRTIGKHNKTLYVPALKLARELKGSSDKTARWIGSDAYRELTNEKIISRIPD